MMIRFGPVHVYDLTQRAHKVRTLEDVVNEEAEIEWAKRKTWEEDLYEQIKADQKKEDKN